MDLESRIVSPDPAVCDLISRVDWIVNAIKEDAGIFHVIREVTDLDLGSDELLQRVDLREVQDIEPAHLQSSEVPLNLSLGGSVPDGRMDFHDAQGIQNVGELPV